MWQVLHLPGLKSASWPSFIYDILLSMALQSARTMMNRPGIASLRDVDQNYYVVLTVRCCKRGPPLLPVVDPADADVELAAGAGDLEGKVMTYWRRWSVSDDDSIKKF